MAEKWYRIPIANSLIRVSSIEFVTPIVEDATGIYSFRLVHRASILPFNVNTVRTLSSNTISSNSTLTGIPTNPIPTVTTEPQNGPNIVSSSNNELVTSIRNDVINILTDNGIDLINNFPDL